MNETRLVSPKNLTAHPLNAELYGDGPDDALVESVRKLGVLTPLVVDEDFQIISGHRRWRAALKLGIEQVAIQIWGFEDELHRLQCLIECNTQREKSNEQRAREGRALLGIEESRAETRRNGKLRKGGKAPVVEALPQREGEGKARDLAAAKIGWSGRTLADAVAVVDEIDARQKAGNVNGAAALAEALNESVSRAHGMLPRKPSTKPAPPPEEDDEDDQADTEALLEANAEAQVQEPIAGTEEGEALNEAVKARAGQLEDDDGVPIPAKAQAAFAFVAEMSRLCRGLDETARLVEQLGKPADGEEGPDYGAEVHRAPAASQIRAARKTIWNGRPYRVCPYCKGQKGKCDGCKSRGWVTKATYHAHPEIAKARREGRLRTSDEGECLEGGDE